MSFAIIIHKNFDEINLAGFTTYGEMNLAWFMRCNEMNNVTMAKMLSETKGQWKPLDAL